MMTNLVLAATRRRAGRGLPLLPDRASPPAWRSGIVQTEVDTLSPTSTGRARRTRACRSSSSSSGWSSAARRCRCATTSCSGCRRSAAVASTGPGSCSASLVGLVLVIVDAADLDRRVHGHDLHRRRAALDRRRSRATPGSSRWPSSRSPASARGSPDGCWRRRGHRRSGSALVVGVVATVPLGVLVRAARGANARDQPRDRHSRARHGDRADAVRQHRLHRRLRRHRSRRRRSSSAGTSTPPSHPSGTALFALGCLRRGGADRRQHPPRADRPPADRRAHERTRGRGARHQRPGAKLYAFGVSAGIAALGGILLAFRTDIDHLLDEFTNFNSIIYVGLAFIGGIGYLFGPIIGGDAGPGRRRHADLRTS